MSSIILCRQCNQPITFSNKHVSQATGKKIPLDPDTQEPHNCPVRREQWRQRQQWQQEQQQQPQQQVLKCSKGCGQSIYFDVNTKTQSGKWIPIDKQTNEPHQCPEFFSKGN